MKSVLLLLASVLYLILSTPVLSKSFTTFKEGSNLPPYGTITRQVVKYGGQGGPDGIDFDDFVPFNYIVAVHSVSISYSDHITSIAATYITAGGQLYTAPLHGKLSGPAINITLGSMEHIWRVEGQTDGYYITQLTFKTLGLGGDHRTYGPYGKGSATKFSFENHVIAFHGGSVNSLNKIGVYGLPPLNASATHGGSGGSAFNDGLPVRIPPVVGISKIMIWSAYVVDAIQVEFITLGGGKFLGAKHGAGGSKNMTTINLGEGDRLSLLKVCTQETILTSLASQLTFGITSASGLNVTHGPYGNIGFKPVNFTGNIMGFFGRAGMQIDNIGVYVV